MTSDCYSGSSLITAEQAIELLLKEAEASLPTEKVSVLDALGRVIAEDIISPVNVPPLANSAMDGYALNTQDCLTGTNKFKQSQCIYAGDVGSALTPNTVARIFTGAAIPEQADAVIVQEQTSVEDDWVCFDGPVKVHQNVRLKGEDVLEGDKVFSVGHRIRAQDMGVIASVGVLTVTVYRLLKVATFFTGEELIEPGDVSKPGKIFDSNRYTIRGLLQAMGCEVIDLGVVRDSLSETQSAMQKAADSADLVLTSGGASVGDKDLIKTSLAALGEINMWRVAVRPGKPIVLGKVNKTPFIGLPGNPVSLFTVFHLFVAPFIKKQQGMFDLFALSHQIKANFVWPNSGDRKELLRAKLEIDQTGGLIANIHSKQGSGVLSSTSWADGFVVIPIGHSVNQGDMVEYIAFNDML